LHCPSSCDQFRTIPPRAMQFATDLLRHCVTRSHRPKETGAREPKATHRIESSLQSDPIPNNPPASGPIRDGVAASLRHTFTLFRGNWLFSAPDSTPIQLAGHGTKWH
jgi:hypothetical protein